MSLKTLFERKLLEARDQTVVGFFPGRFQPFHKGHKQVFDDLREMCGESTYILTSDDTSSYKSPLTFEDKHTVMTQMCDIPSDRILKVKSPYSVPTDLSLDEYSTVVVFAVSAKDMQGEARFQFPDDGSKALRTDGAPKYLQKFPGSVDQCEPMATHAYVMEVDVHQFEVAGRVVQSATDLRELLVGPEEEAKVAFEDMYDQFDQQIFDLLRGRITNKVLAFESHGQWCPNTKVRNGNQLKTVYHGGPTGIVTFDRDRIGSTHAQDVDGFFFTNNSNEYVGAGHFAARHTNGKVYEAHLCITNPYTVDDFVDDIGDTVDNYTLYAGEPQHPIDLFDDSREEIIANAKRRGCDGIIFESGGEELYVVFSPTQIQLLDDSVGITEAAEFDADDLEAFRLASIRELAGAAEEIERLARGVLDHDVTGFEIVGSVLDKTRFTAESDVDGVIYVHAPSLPAGVLDDETERMQQAMLSRWFSFGVLNIGVINRLSPLSESVDTLGPAFRSWFRGSKVVDRRGVPLTVYHGTKSEFEQFEPNRDGLIFFARDPEYIHQSITSATHIIPAYLRVTNPLIPCDHLDELRAAGIPEKDLEYFCGSQDWSVIESYAATIKRAGFDGIFMEEGVGDDTFETIAVFDNDQIKHALTTPISEGGNVWKDLLATSRVERQNVLPTIKWLESVTGLALVNNTLGTTGRRADSGDIDLAVDGMTSKSEIQDRLDAWAAKNDPNALTSRSGSSVHFRCPIAGKPENGYVQVDFMFVPDVEFAKWSMAAHPSKYTVADRFIVMSSIARTLGLKFTGTHGLIDRETNTPVDGGKDPDVIARTLLGKNATAKSLTSLEAILAALDADPNKEAKLADARGALARRGVEV